MTNETEHEAIPEALYDYKVIAGVAIALVAIVIAYYYVRKYVPSEITTLHVVEQQDTEKEGA